MSNLKRFLALTLAVLMIVGGATMASAKSFTDVAATANYSTAVDVLSNLKVIAGTTPTEFEPGANVTREQFALLMARYISGVPDAFAQPSPNATAPFSDCKDPTYFAAIQYCKDKGIINGVSEKKFDPKGNITFEQAMKMMVVALGYTDIKGGTGSTWSLPYIQKANDLTVNSGPTDTNLSRVKVNMFNGFENKTYTAAMTRGECALLMYNAFRADMSDTYTEYRAATVNGSSVLVPTVINKTIAINIFNCEEIKGLVTANKDYAMVGSGKAGPKKDASNPIIILNSDKTYKQFDLLKSDVNTFNLIGKEVSYLIKNNTIVSDLATLGAEVAIESISYNNADGARKLTVNGELYDLQTWPEDRIVYTWNDWVTTADANYGKLTQLTADKANEFLPVVNYGFYKAVFNDNINFGDVLILYPMSVGKAGGERTASSYIVDGTNLIKDKGYPQVNLNEVEAAENDYILYYNNSAAKIFYVTAKATKAEGITAGTIYNDHKKAVFGSTTYEILDHTTMNTLARSSKFNPLQKYNVYTVDGKVVYTENYDSGAYNQKTYYVLQRFTTLDRDDSGRFTYGVYLLNTSGSSQGRLNITAYNYKKEGATEYFNIPTAPLTQFASDAFNLYGKFYHDANTPADYVGTIVAKDPDNGSRLIKDKANDNFMKAADKDIWFEAGATTLETAGASNLYRLDGIGGAGNNYFTTADYSKFLVKFSDKYVAYSGKSSLPNLKNSTITKVEAVLTTRDSVAIPTISFMYIESSSKAETAIIPATGDMYLVVTRETYSGSNETYKVLNPITGEVTSGVVYSTTDAKATPATFNHNDIVLVRDNKITAKPSYTFSNIGYANGYFTFASEPAANVSTKVWVWHTDGYYEQKNSDYIGGGKTGYVAIDGSKAVWAVAIPQQVTITYALNKNTSSDNAAIVSPATVSYTVGTTIKLPGQEKVSKLKPVLDTWTVVGWTDVYDTVNDDLTKVKYWAGSDFTLNADTTLYAVWMENFAPVAQYTVKFNALGGTGTMDSVVVNSGVDYALPECKFVREGHEFLGWTTNPANPQPANTYEVGAKITISGNVTLYPIWYKI